MNKNLTKPNIQKLFLLFREARTSIRKLILWEINSLTYKLRKGRKYSYKNISANNYGSWTHVNFPEAITTYKENQNEMEITNLITEIPSKKTSFLMLLIGFTADFIIIIAFLFIVGWFWLLSIMGKTIKLSGK